MYTSFNFTRPQMLIRPHYGRPAANPVSHQSQSLTFGIGVGQDRKGIYFEDDRGRKRSIKWDNQAHRYYAGSTFLSPADVDEYVRLKEEESRMAQEIGDDASSESSAVKPSGSKEKKEKKGLLALGKKILTEAVEGGSKGAAEGLVKERGAELLGKVVPRRRHDIWLGRRLSAESVWGVIIQNVRQKTVRSRFASAAPECEAMFGDIGG